MGSDSTILEVATASYLVDMTKMVIKLSRVVLFAFEEYNANILTTAL